MHALEPDFFDTDAEQLAKALLGKRICHKVNNLWLETQIIETEAYYKKEKGSHASLGYTEKRRALFMPPGTIYMYYARGKDSFNISSRGEGNAVLIKSALAVGTPRQIGLMQQLNPMPDGRPRPIARLCSGQTLLCTALDLKVPEWDGKAFDPRRLYIKHTGYEPERIIQTTRLGIPHGRDEHLPLRFIDYDFAQSCTQNPLTRRSWRKGIEYQIIKS